MKTKFKVLTLASTLLALTLTGCGEPSATSSQKGSSSGDNSSSGPVSSVSSADATEEEEYEDAAWDGKVKIYYHNDQNDYTTKRIWAWCTGVDGAEYEFDNQKDFAQDDYGVYKVFDMSSAPWAGNVASTFSFIIKEVGSWDGQSTDTIVHFGRFVNAAVDDTITVYSCPGSGSNIDTYVNKKDALGDRVASASFTGWKTIHVVGGGTEDGRAASEIGKVASYELYAFDNAYYKMKPAAQAAAKANYKIKEGTPNAKEFDIALDNDAIPNLGYTIEAKMNSDTSKTKSKAVAFTTLYDDATFISKYTYSGNDLGISDLTSEGITFKLWAPTAFRVQVKIYYGGVPADYITPFNAANNNGRLFDMEIGDHGVWQIRVEGNFVDNEQPYFYNYVVTNAVGSSETVDPYATACGINGERGAIIDWDSYVKPEGWDNIKGGKLLTSITEGGHVLPNRLTVYESHIRDLTADKSWKGNAKRGTYEAYIESGVKYGNVAAGFDHIKDFGATAVQLLPVFDQSNDERWLDANGEYTTLKNAEKEGVTAPGYNWGYNPQNYNCIEGAYSTDPFSATRRIDEFMNLVQACANADIRVIMDVVYNHVASINSSPFTKTMPDYYFRIAENGKLYDGTGCGNVVATERKMASKFVVDSVCHWAKRFNIKGFRFDLMGCIDTITMRNVKDALYDIDPEIVVYGEGWAGSGDGGFADVAKKAYPNIKAAALGHVYGTLYPTAKGGIGAFSNGFRNGVKGDKEYSTPKPEWGYVDTGSDYLNNDLKKKVGEGIIGANYFNYDADDSGVKFGANCEQTVSYVACHDNYGLYDQLNYCINSQTAAQFDTGTEAFEAAVASQASVLLNQGIAFINGGDEIFRQKVMTTENTDEKTISKMAESIAHKKNEYAEWDEGDGIKMANGDYLVRNSYQYGDGVNSYKWDRKVTYFKYYEKIREAVKFRKAQMGNLFGRAYGDGVDDRSANNVFDSTYDDASSPLVAVYMGGKKDSSNYYVLFGGRMSDTYTSLSCGNCHVTVQYASNLSSVSWGHKAGQEFDITNGMLGAGKYEFLLVKATSL